MRRVIVYQLMSLDGVAEAPDKWLFDFDADMYQNLADVIGKQDDVLLGRVTYDEWSEFWPTSTHEPFASFINATPKHIASSDTQSLDWSNSEHMSGPVEQYVSALKARPGRDIGVHGSITLANSLLAAGLVDELQLVVAPALAREGRGLLDAVHDVRRLELVGSKPAASGSLLLTYNVRKSDG